MTPMTVAVVAHSEKKLGEGLGELRRILAAAGFKKPIWREVTSSRKAPQAIRHAVKKGASLIYVWGGDGMVQRSIDALADTKGVDLAIIPAGTANLLATELAIPRDIAKAVKIGLLSGRRNLDVGNMNGERFAVMAGTGLDSLIMRSVGHQAKERLGRLAYFRSGVAAVQAPPVQMTVRVDGAVWFKGKASALLTGNIGTVTGGLVLFPDASPTDGMLEIGVVTAASAWQWVRVFSRVAAGHPERSPFVRMTRGKKVTIKLGRKMPYELDGGARPPTKKLKIRIAAGAIAVCVPPARSVARRIPKASRLAARPPRTTKARSRRPPASLPSEETAVTPPVDTSAIQPSTAFQPA
jgi:diacylglycerol kinase (ATP)